MAHIKVEDARVHFNPYTNTPDSHFERVTKDIFNELHDDVSYSEYVSLAEDRGVSAVTKSDLKDFKNDVESDINRIITSLGIDTLNDLLLFADRVDLSVDWEARSKSISKKYPNTHKPKEPRIENGPREPKPDDERFEPNLSIIDYILPYRKRRKREEMERKFEKAHSQWEKKKKEVEQRNQRAQEEYERRLENWKEKKKKSINELRERYRSSEQEAVEKIVADTLDSITYPSPQAFDKLQSVFKGEIEVTFKDASGVLIVDRAIPPPQKIPRRKKIQYVKSRGAFKGKDLSKRDFNQLYESIPYQIALRTAYEVFGMDAVEGNVIDTVVFNGWVTSVNPATGHEETVCTLSLQASREEIMGLNLSQVDPKAAFKNLKGVSASKLREKSPVTPIVQADRSDSRFTEGRDVGEDMQEGENIAAMDWEDFEHLIRELFESEFAEEGGEVNVTQASRDGGIDAVAFDPDPLRGGKIVIQAKRYTQTVGVSAVRDLYGTVMNEGASRGILVTTSDYGSGAYDFAKDKPIQLLDGGNLLSMLEQHGYDARIDVEEARENME